MSQSKPNDSIPFFSRHRTVLGILSALFLIWCLVFFISHKPVGKGLKYVQLTSDQLDIINALNTPDLYPIDTSYAEFDTLREPDKSNKIYQLKLRSDTIRIDELNRYIQSIDIDDTIRYKTEQAYLTEVHKRYFKAKSYFWLNDKWLIIEVIMFALLGVLCNSLYHISENIRRNTYNPNEAIVYYVKLLYAPAITLIIYLGYALFTNVSQEVATVTNTIVLSFILGFFSGKSIELLQRVKNFLMPSASVAPPATTIEVETPELKTFLQLKVDTQKEIINEYIATNEANLKAKYPEIQGYSATRRKRDGLELDYYTLHIDVSLKAEDQTPEKTIPSTLPYVWEGQKYDIPTDIEEVGENQISLFTGEGEMPKMLGLSCSREKSEVTGTIGLKVMKGGKTYLLSCYHVLCAPELENEITNFTSADNPTVISPSLEDRKTKSHTLGTVAFGKLTNRVDAALVLLNKNNDLNSEFYPNNGNPQKKVELGPVETRAKILVKLFGRSSERSYGRLLDHYQQVAYFKNYPKNTIDRLHDLIVTSKISIGGDSGAAVVTGDNHVIGILVGSNKTKSYVIPIQRILDIFDASIILD